MKKFGLPSTAYVIALIRAKTAQKINSNSPCPAPAPALLFSLGCPEIGRGVHRLHRSSSQNEGAVRTRGTDNRPLQRRSGENRSFRFTIYRPGKNEVRKSKQAQ